MEVIGKFNGIVHLISDDFVIASRGSKVFIKKTNEKWKFLCRVPISKKNKLKSIGKVLRRLFRSQINHIRWLENNTLIIFGFGSIYIYDFHSKRAKYISKLSGSRPLCIMTYKNYVYYGEYFSNEARIPVKILGSKDYGNAWEIMGEIENIRHVHGIFKDPYSNEVWITTGDKDQESVIWKADLELTNIKKVLYGSQQLRAVALCFNKDYVYFGSDTPLEKNHIYRFNKETNKTECLQEVKGSIFYGITWNGNLLFSTVYEASNINKSKIIELWFSIDGERWKRIKSFKKDFLHNKLFQYGQVMFPYLQVENPAELWITPFAVKKHDQESIKLKI